jgi:hypothetical protein
LAMVKGIGPKDEVEAMMAAQMAAVHMATMTFARRLVHVDNILQQDSAERAFNKLARTFAVQVEALKRYRTGGEQKVTVQHVTVNEGGQAIVGSVSPQVGGIGDAGKSRCRMHGGTSTGPRTSEGLERMRRANTRHGIYSEERRRLMQAVRKLVREAEQTAEET